MKTVVLGKYSKNRNHGQKTDHNAMFIYINFKTRSVLYTQTVLYKVENLSLRQRRQGKAHILSCSGINKRS